jgi:hypothetical protein
MNFIQQAMHKILGTDFVDIRRGFSVTTERVVWENGIPCIHDNRDGLVCVDDIHGVSALTPKIKRWME